MRAPFLAIEVTMPLFSKFDLSGLPLPNRIVMAPMTRSRAQAECADELTAAYYRQRVTAGLIISEGVPISSEAVGYAFLPGISTEEQIAGWRQTTASVHEGGGRIFSQLWHVGRVSHTSLQEGGRPPVSSTDAPAAGDRAFAYAWRDDGSVGFVQPSAPRALETSEIPRVVADYVLAARRALAAGFDGVEVHAAHGYLVEQFLNPKINQRIDRYGGSLEARTRLLLEIVDGIASVTGPGRLGVRLSPNASLLGAPPYEGNTETYLYAISELGRRQLGYVHLSDTGVRAGVRAVSDQFLLQAREVFPGAIVLAGGLDKERAEPLVASGLIDLAAIGQPFIANPDLVERLRRGWALAKPNRDTYYGGGGEGYIDYPASVEAG